MQHLSSQTMLKQVELVAQVLVSLLLYMYKSIKAVNLRTDEAQQVTTT